MTELFSTISSLDFLSFKFHSISYSKQLKNAQNNTKQLCGITTFKYINHIRSSFNFNFLGGSLGCAECQKLVLSVREAKKLKIPFVLETASGGIRMQEGAAALQAMPILCAILSDLRRSNLVICICGDPTFGGVSASILNEADLIIGIEGARVGFAGRDVVKNTIFAGNQVEMDKTLQNGFQTSERCAQLRFFDFFIKKDNLENLLDCILQLQNNKIHKFSTLERDSAEIFSSFNFKECRCRTRPLPIDYARNIFTLKSQLCSDGQILIFIAQIDNQNCILILTHKDDLTDPISGLGTPMGYRAAGKAVLFAGKMNLPVFTIVDTSGALPSPSAEDQNQAQAISQCLTDFARTGSFIASVITGEGGSGGAIAIAAGNAVGAIEKSFYNVISPEGGVSILGRSVYNNEIQKQKDNFENDCLLLAESQKCYPGDLVQLGILDVIIKGWDIDENSDKCTRTSARIKDFFLMQCDNYRIEIEQDWAQMRLERNIRILQYTQHNYVEFSQSIGQIPLKLIKSVESVEYDLNFKKVMSFIAKKTIENKDKIIKLPSMDIQGEEYQQQINQQLTAGYILNTKGPKQVVEYLNNSNTFFITDTTFRDAHQSILATRLRTKELLQAAQILKNTGLLDIQDSKFFSVECWGGATFDTAYRYLQEDPWERLRKFKEILPNTLTQMLIRGKNAVGYTSYPDNVIEQFIIKSAENGLDVFRIFDAFNDLNQMKISVETVINKTNKICEICVCFTGFDDIYNIAYYVEKIIEIRNRWPDVHIICLKDMAGLLRPELAFEFFSNLINVAEPCPIHFHTHDTSGLQSATILEAIKAGVKIVDLASNAFSALSSQPPLQSIIFNKLSAQDQQKLEYYDQFWSRLRKQYQFEENSLNAPQSNVYNHQMPGGQISNLYQQCIQMGLEEKWEQCMINYQESNEFFGRIIKVTPSSKVVGDLALFMTQKQIQKQDLYRQQDLPVSVIQFIQGDLGFPHKGFPQQVMNIVQQQVQEQKVNLDFQNIQQEVQKYCENPKMEEILSYILYPDVFKNYCHQVKINGKIEQLPVEQFLYGMRIGQQIQYENYTIQLVRIHPPEFDFTRKCEFLVNNNIYYVNIKQETQKPQTLKMVTGHGNEVECDVLGIVQGVYAQKGDKVELGARLFRIVSSKLEIVVSAKQCGILKEIHVAAGQRVVPGCLLGRLE
ncbi:Acetyl-CoA carboxylase/pyruvate carboxylase fusion protein [Spironucleus salmonicida]|uniref:Acetyl-coenzyme A carboxylase carboxyl transferase subunits beta/alpha n=1 Tax=Spironucleus salmonicida TaxID=348837 RepID=V6LTI8_9EUKA|nr:Acetyl-CoA carboxylase/pyruvate carboxylase fusion protein [Spironucleus salmonicida]|eukprot:EST47568.1 Acetyl-CoA carboxylase/pyruvate carboxylase fusion protein [Spironucleus salmonicida]